MIFVYSRGWTSIFFIYMDERCMYMTTTKIDLSRKTAVPLCYLHKFSGEIYARLAIPKEEIWVEKIGLKQVSPNCKERSYPNESMPKENPASPPILQLLVRYRARHRSTQSFAYLSFR